MSLIIWSSSHRKIVRNYNIILIELNWRKNRPEECRIKQFLKSPRSKEARNLILIYFLVHKTYLQSHCTHFSYYL